MKGSIFYLTADINLAVSDSWGPMTWTGGTPWQRIHAFGGTLDGRGHKTSGFEVSSSDTAYTEASGFFAQLYDGAWIRNLYLSGSVSYSSAGMNCRAGDRGGHRLQLYRQARGRFGADRYRECSGGL